MVSSLTISQVKISVLWGVLVGGALSVGAGWLASCGENGSMVHREWFTALRGAGCG
jgi:hypothetical protein